MFLFVPETTYHREAMYETDINQADNFEKLDKAKEEHREHVAVKELNEGQAPMIPPKKTFLQELKLYNGVFSHDNIIKWIFGMFLTLLNPAGCYAIIVSGLLCAWYVGSAIILAGIFAGPPWTFDPAQIGYLGTGPFVGGMIGSIIVALLGDPVIKWMTKKNKGT